MKRIVLAFVAVALLASTASAGGFGLNLFGGRGVNVQVGGGGLFGRRAVVVQQPVVVQQRFVPRQQVIVQQRAFVPRQQVIVQQRQFVPSYSSVRTFNSFAPVQAFGFSGGYGNVQTFAAPVGGCGSFLSLGVGY